MGMLKARSVSSPGVIMIYKPGYAATECFVCLGRIRRTWGYWTCDLCRKGCCIPCTLLRNLCACDSMFPDYRPGENRS